MEGRWCCKSLLLQLVLIIATARLSQCTLQSEIDANTQTVKFDEIYDAKDWKSQDAFITAMTTAVNDYCSNTTNMASCQLTSFDSNSTFMVVAVGEGGFTYINGDIQVDFYVRFPDSGVDTSGPNEFVLEKSVVTTITELNENAINSATNQTLVFIGNTRLYPIDNSVNVIMIPVAIVILVLVILLAVVLQCIQSRGEKKHQQLLINKPEEGSSKKGEEAITLTAVKRPGYDGAAADSSESKDPQPTADSAEIEVKVMA